MKLGDFRGQPTISQQLDIAFRAARARGTVCGHVLFAGPAGLGKTSLAHIVAEEMGGKFVPISATMLKKPSDVVTMLMGLRGDEVVFIDEIHRLGIEVQEMFYTAMEGGYLDFIAGKGTPGASAVRIQLPKFTLVGATTRIGDVGKPMRDRFKMVLTMQFYDEQELALIVDRAAGDRHAKVTEMACRELARRSQGTPRIALKLLDSVVDYAMAKSVEVVRQQDVEDAMAMVGVDELGLDKMEQAILACICYEHGGGPVGLASVAISVGEEVKTVEEVHEPFLVRMGLMIRTPRGRVVSAKGWDHVNGAKEKVRG